jgi:anti-sigma factor RsiW
VNCQEAQDVIHAYTDGELDLVTTLDIEKHITDCSECAKVHRNLLTLRTSIRDSSLYYRAPAALERQIRLKISQASPERSPRARIKAGGRNIVIYPGRWVAVAAALAIVATTVWVALRGTGGAGGRSDQLLASEVTSAHIRSLMTPEHLWDVKSSDQHTVKPWFDGKIDFAPNVRDFKADSYALEGGRLDYLADRPVAALVYRHEKHYINLFIWPAGTQADQGESLTTRQGYVLIHWVQSGMNYWAASDTSEEGLRRFTNLVRGVGSPSPATKP